MDPFLFFIIIFIKWDWVRKQNWTEIFGRFLIPYQWKKKKKSGKIISHGKLLVTSNWSLFTDWILRTSQNFYK